MRYLKSGFWPARRFARLRELDEQYADWRDRICNRRLHATRPLPRRRAARRGAAALRPLPPARFDWSGHRTTRVPVDGYLRHGGCFYRAPERLVHERVELRFDRDQVWIAHRGVEVARYQRSYEQGLWLPPPIMRPEPPTRRRRSCCRGSRSRRPSWPTTRSCAHEPRRRRASGCRTCSAKLKAPRVLERLEQTAALAREQEWPYERFLETLLEAEVFARDASGARMRIRHAAFPALKTLEDFDWSAQPCAEKPLVLHLAQLAWIEEHANVCFFGPPGTGKTHLRDRARPQSLRARLPRRLRHRAGMGLPPRGRPGPQPARGRAAPARALPPAHRRRGRLPAARTPGRQPALRLVSRRYERGSIIVTSNRGFEQWGEILGDAMVAAALIDRLVHHATMITLKGKSYRLRERGLDVAPAAQAPSLRDSA